MLNSAALPASEFADFAASLESYPPRAVRVHHRVLESSLPFETTSVPWYTAGRILTDTQIRPSQFLEYAIGDYYIQDAGSMLAIALAEPNTDDVVCDLCAAPGGKASAILEQLTGQGYMLANEVISSRIGILRHHLGRTGSMRYCVTSQDPDVIAATFDEQFDLIVVDAPCSGQVLTVKDKRSENAFSSKHIEHAALRQRRILRAAMSMLKVGGRIVYSTCTFADAENEDQILWMQRDFPGAFTPFPAPQLAPWQSPLAEGCYRIWPHRHPSAGAFAARLQKVDAVPRVASGIRSKKDILHSKRTAKPNSKHRTGHLCDIFDQLGVLHSIEIRGDNEHLRGCVTGSIAERWLAEGKTNDQHLPLLGIIKNENITPTQELAHADVEFFTSKQTIDLNDNEARIIVAGQALMSQRETGVERGYVQAKWRNKALGWLKAVGNRYNNQLSSYALQTS